MAVGWQSWYSTRVCVITEPVLFARRPIRSQEEDCAPRKVSVVSKDNVTAHWIPTAFQTLSRAGHAGGQEVG